ncbi:hypothetical protein ACIQGZ_17495 [Streptomyces sp. NPDC092296]|uniref:hypothetical protein n=1 Tax=Streptomyces sp. NPDC092296 TaxID=3366012 RepID=UPI003803975F
MTESSPGGEPVRTAWTDWCRDEACFDADTYVRFVEIVPAPDARVLRIDTLADLRTVVAAFPADPFYPGQRQEYPDWHAMAAAGWDAVWLTDDGQRATPYGEPNLYGWDCESVLWLHPAYSCKEVAR